jgi:integrase
MPRKAGVPSYRRKVVQGRDYACVTLRDRETKRSRDFLLGRYDSPESRERYALLLVQWERSGRKLPEAVRVSMSRVGGLTITQLCDLYWQEVGSRMTPAEQDHTRLAIRVLRRTHGETAATKFGPRALQVVRASMASDSLPGSRKRWSRKYINSQIRRIWRLFRWAVSQELVSVDVHAALKTIEPLKRGELGVDDEEPVQPVQAKLLEATRKHCGEHVRAMIDLQLLTGMRPGELCAMRICDIDMSSRVWTYQPTSHKTLHRGKRRTIYLGPAAQDLIHGFIRGRPLDAHVFSPTESEAARSKIRRSRRETPLYPSHVLHMQRKRQPEPIVQPGECYTSCSYRRAIQRACDRAFPPPAPLAKREGETEKQWQQRLTKKQNERLREWRKAHRWHPHQLRHTYATEVRKRYGLEAAQILLGHSSAVITDAVYAERDMTKAMEIAAAMG